MENSRYFHTFIHYNSITHNEILVHVDPGNEKLALLSPIQYNNITLNVILVHVDPGNGKLTLLSHIHHNNVILIHVDPENGKLELLSTFIHYNNTQRITRSCRSRKWKTHVTSTHAL